VKIKLTPVHITIWGPLSQLRLTESPTKAKVKVKDVREQKKRKAESVEETGHEESGDEGRPAV